MPPGKPLQTLYADRALLPEGWAENVALTIDDAGLIEDINCDLASPPQGAQQVNGILLPGIPNCHSHAFQRIMVGLTERRGSSDDNFWSWRDAMYRSLDKIGPDELQAISAQLYIEMLKLGYTGVAEFHYLHHSQDGSHYSDPAEMSHRVIAAAQTVGIHITHLPVLYCHSDFGEQPPTPGQRRFIHSLDAYQSLLQQLHSRYQGSRNVHLGIAPHSLRAVGAAQLKEAIAAIDSLDNTAPIHIHIAEQQREVDSCIAHSGARPVAWLLDHFDVNERWCLIHATHLAGNECSALAASGAVAGLCPTTEANLGDGLFPAVEYLQQGGHFAIGSDSQVTLSPREELRLLEYGQRLFHQKRTLLADEQQPSVGETLYRGAVAGGARALGLNTGAIRAGARADLLVLDSRHPSLYGKAGSAVLDSWIFAGHTNPVNDVMVGGHWSVRDGIHPQQEAVADSFRHMIDMKKLA
jgi:formimidoylglutamate deiminase